MCADYKSAKEVRTSDDDPPAVHVTVVARRAQTCCQKCCYESCLCCRCCCNPDIFLPRHIVVPADVTVEKFLEIATEAIGTPTPFDVALIDGFILKHSDKLAPSLKAFEHFQQPIVVVLTPPSGCCNLI